MLKYSSENDKFKKLSEQNKKNRLSDPEGLSPLIHTCGSILISEMKRRLVSKERINKCICDIQYIYIYLNVLFFVGQSVR